MSTPGVLPGRAEMGEALQAILAGGKFVNDYGGFEAAVDLYKLREEARTQPREKVKEDVFNLIVNKLLDVAHLGFLQFTLSKGADEAKKKGKLGSPELVDVEASLPPLRPDVEFVLLVDGTPASSSALRISFELDSTVAFKGMRAESNEGRKSLSAQSINATLGLYLIEKMIIGQHRTKLGHRSFEVRGFRLADNDLRGWSARNAAPGQDASGPQ